MKRFILQNLFLVSFLIIAGLTYSANAECPPEKDPITGQYGGPWIVDTITKYKYVDPETGCSGLVVYNICFRVNATTRENEISFSNIQICDPTCDPRKMFTAELRDKLIIDALTHDEIKRRLDYGEELPFCPGGICALKIWDRICYSDWELNENGCWVMRTCDNELRSCNEGLQVCIDPDTKEPVIIDRVGSPVGPDCPEGCRAECDY